MRHIGIICTAQDTELNLCALSMCVDMCADMSTDIYVDTCVDICGDMCNGICGAMMYKPKGATGARHVLQPVNMQSYVQGRMLPKVYQQVR